MKKYLQLEIEYPPSSEKTLGVGAGSSDLQRSEAERDEREPSEHHLRQYGGEKGLSGQAQTHSTNIP